MNEMQYYHSAVEQTLLNQKAAKARIDARIARLPQKERQSFRISPRLVIALVAAATFLIASVTFAAVLVRNQIFKNKTNEVLDETVKTVTEPLNTETHEGWQPGQLILFDNVQSIAEEVVCPVSTGVIQLSELYYSKYNGLTAHFFFRTDRKDPPNVRSICMSINGAEPVAAYYIDAFDRYIDGYFLGEAAVSKLTGNPFWPGMTVTVTGTVDDEPFTLTYTFTEETYRKLQQGVVDTVNAHKSLVEQIPDTGTEVNYRRDNQTLAEVAYRDGLMYFTILHSGEQSAADRPYSDYDSGTWPVIDGRVGEFFSLGVVDGPYEEGAVYSTCVPYPADKLPQESLVAFMSIMFRYEWATGKVTVPKDEAEYTEWRRESKELSEPYCEQDWIWHFDAKGALFGVEDLVFHNHSLSGTIGVVLNDENGFDMADVIETAEDAPVVAINGVRLRHYGELDPHENICGNLTSDHLKKGYMLVGFAAADLTDPFTLTVTYRGETVETTLRLSDMIRMDDAYDDIYEDAFDY